MAYTNDVTGEALPFGPTLRVDRKSNFSMTVTNRVVAATNHFPVNSTAYNYWKNPGSTNMHTHGMHSATGGLPHYRYVFVTRYSCFPGCSRHCARFRRSSQGTATTYH